MGDDAEQLRKQNEREHAVWVRKTQEKAAALDRKNQAKNQGKKKK